MQTPTKREHMGARNQRCSVGILHLLWNLLIFSLTTIAESKPEKQDVCMGELFSASCGPHEVIIMHSASYGRMAAGRCLSVEFGFLGCSSDVLFLTDRWCSGRSQCEFFVPQKEFDTVNEDCSKDLRAYLRISYSCIPVSHTGGYQCADGDTISLSGPEGYLSTDVSATTGCGTYSAPWRIEADPGQVVEISLIEFTTQASTTDFTLESTTGIYGYITETSIGVNKTIFGIDEREKLIYTSETNIVDIFITSVELRETDRFLIHYKFVGCSDITPPEDAWFERKGSQATIGCNENDATWRLKCEGTTWEGDLGNCTEAVLMYKKSVWMTEFKVAILSAVIGLTVVTIAVVIAVGVCHIKKRRRRRTRQLPHPCEGGKALSGYATNPYYQPFNHGGTTTRTDIESCIYAQVKKPRVRHVSTDTNKSVHIWETPLPTPSDKDSVSSECACSRNGSYDRKQRKNVEQTSCAGDDDTLIVTTNENFCPATQHRSKNRDRAKVQMFE